MANEDKEVTIEEKMSELVLDTANFGSEDHEVEFYGYILEALDLETNNDDDMANMMELGDDLIDHLGDMITEQIRQWFELKRAELRINK